MDKKVVLIGLSGGIDSSISAYLLKKQGFKVIGVFLILHKKENLFKQDLENSRKVANFLQIPFYTLDISDKFFQTVYKPFVDSYIAGKTPNPCIICNKEIKFGEMFKFAKKLNIQFLATGHYLKSDKNFIYQANDKTKDQSYFLFNINKNILPNLIFPLSNLTKQEVKSIAKNIPILNDINKNRESHEICFVENNYIDIIKEFYNNIFYQEGNLVDSQGKIIGIHKGYVNYTIGQRKGFSVRVAHEPHYVKEIFPKDNIVVVGKKNELFSNRVILENLNMFIDEVSFKAEIKLRYRAEATPCFVEIKDNKAFIQLDNPVFGLAKGQAGVFYKNNKLLGGGWII